MSNPTLQSPKRPSSQRSAQQRRRTKGAARTATVFRKQTARLEGRRDGTPLFFGWGRHLTRAQKTRLQQNAAYIFFGAVSVGVIGLILFGLLQQAVLIPNATIVNINGVSVAQDTYRKLLAYDAQDLWNQMQANIKKHDDLSDRQARGDNSVATDLAIVTSQVEAQEGNYAQATLTQSTIDQITEDQLIQQGAARYEQHDKSALGKLTPKPADIEKQWLAFKSAFPPNEKYSDFLSKNGLSDDDVKAAVALHMRRDLMQAYLAAQLTSPTRQVHLRHIVTSGADDSQARNALSELQKKNLLSTSASWGDVAKKESVDTDSKDQGGDIGWVPQGHGDAGVEVWAYDPARKVGDWQIIHTASGTFDVVQILGIDPSRPVDAATLKNSQDNALSHWLGGQRVAPFNHISTPDADMLQATRNLPHLPDLKAQLPNYNPNQGTGAPGSIPGLPSGG